MKKGICVGCFESKTLMEYYIFQDYGSKITICDECRERIEKPDGCPAECLEKLMFFLKNSVGAAL